MADIKKPRNPKNNIAKIKGNLPPSRGSKKPKSKGAKKIKNSSKKTLKPSQDTIDLLNAIVNPLDNMIPVRCNDNRTVESVSMFDFVSTELPTSNVTSVAPASGVVIMIIYGANAFSTTPWSVFLAPIDANGLWIGGYQITMSNYSSMQTLGKAFRLLAGGLRVLPLIEFNTNSANQYITRYHGGCLTPTDILRWSGAGQNIYTIIKQATDYKTTINMQGMCGRYNPAQQVEQLDFYSFANLSSIAAFDTSSVYYPTIVVQFAQPVSPIANVYTWPLLLDAKYWFEVILTKPSPVAMKLTSYDVLVLLLLKELVNDNSFPCICEGHSFSSFFSKGMKFLSKVRSKLDLAIGIGNAIAPFLL